MPKALIFVGRKLLFLFNVHSIRVRRVFAIILTLCDIVLVSKVAHSSKTLVSAHITDDGKIKPSYHRSGVTKQ